MCQMKAMAAQRTAFLLLLIPVALSVQSLIPLPLEVKELRQVRQPSDPSGLEQNITVVLDPHDILDNAEIWELTLFMNEDPKQKLYYCSANDEQTVLSCEGMLLNANGLLLLAFNGYQNQTLASQSLQVDITDFGSRVAWVGDSDGGGAAYLRVQLGTIENVDVDGVQGKLTCAQPDTVCYYHQAQVSGQPEDLAVSRCKDVLTSIDTNIFQCDEVVALFPPLNEDPELVLSQDTQLLSITHSTGADTLELVAEPSGGDVSFQTCTDADNACSFYVSLQDLKTLQRTLVFLNSENYATNASSFEMEVYKISLHQVTVNSVGVEWDDASPGLYLVTVVEKSKAPIRTITQVVQCNAAPCNTYFTNLDFWTSVKISVKKEDENMAVDFAWEFQETPPSSVLQQVTRVEMGSVVTVVSVSGATVADPATSTVVLVRSRIPPTSTMDDVVEWKGDITQTTDGYTAQFDVDLLEKEGRFDFLVILYNEDRQVDNAASATLDIARKDIGLKVDLIGSEGEYVRVSTTSSVELSVNNKLLGSCNTVPPCYVQMQPQPLPGVSVCTTTPLPPSPALCQQMDPTPPLGMAISPQVQLVKGGQCEDTLRVTSNYDATTTIVEVYLVDILEPQICNDPTVPCVIFVNACLPGSFDVLVTGIGLAGEVVETATVSINASSDTESGVILVSVLSAVFGTILIIFFVIVIIKTRQSKKRMKHTAAPMVSSDISSVGVTGSDSRETIPMTTRTPVHAYEQSQYIKPYRAYEPPEQIPHPQHRQQPLNSMPPAPSPLVPPLPRLAPRPRYEGYPGY